MMHPEMGFAVIYQFRVTPGKEDQFQKGWERTTLRLMQERGALGSRLHRAADGTWVAYAQWPSEAAWQESRERGAVDPEASRMMRESQEELLEPIFLTPVVDHLRPVAIPSTDPGQ